MNTYQNVELKKSKNSRNADIARISEYNKEMKIVPNVCHALLAEKLESIPELLRNIDHYNNIDIKDFDMKNVEKLEEIKEIRQKIVKKIKNFNDNGRTNINYDNAAIAGAKLIIDERVVTRNYVKKLADEIGVKTNKLLYQPIPMNNSESEAAKNIRNYRQDSIIESYMDFQYQLKFKKQILIHLDKKVNEEQGIIEESTTRRTRKNNKQFIYQTPENKRIPDPLNFTGIMKDYAKYLASEIIQKSKCKEKMMPPIVIDFDVEDTGY